MKHRIFKYIADLRFAIFILLLISICSVIGTVIEQEQPIEIYKLNYSLDKKLFGFLSWDKILFFGFDHVYKTWWFFSLILIFGISLIACTFLQQIPSVKITRKCQFFRTLEPFNKLKISTLLTTKSLSLLIYQLKILNYSVFQQKNLFYCYKGLIGRIAPIFVHFSMILILLGTLIGSFSGFKAQEIIPKTENYHIQNILTNGPFTKIPNFSVRINDFWITYTKQKTVSQFYSDLSVLDNRGNEIKHKTSFVNSPIIYKNIYFYQTDWNLNGIRINYDINQLIEYPLVTNLSNKNKLWLTWVSNTNNLTDGVVSLIDNLEGYCSLYDNQGLFLGNIESNEIINHKNIIQLVDILSSTGLQIKLDPGITVIYIGFLFLMTSTLISYITYSQIWLTKKKNQLFIGGNTTRALFEFELEFLKLIK